MRFPEIAAAVARLAGRSLVLDGELCVFDANLVSQFHLIGDERAKEAATPPVLIPFDALYVRGRDITGRPLSDRRQALEVEIAGSSFILSALRLERDGLPRRERAAANRPILARGTSADSQGSRRSS